MKSRNFSLVIPTLNGLELEQTLYHINRGTILPTEILIVIPIEFQENVKNYLCFSNIHILGVDFRGQVQQRIFGFKCAKYDIVVQLDDDIIVDPHCFENLIDTINDSDFKVAVSPLFKFDNSKISCYELNKRNYLLNKFIHGKKYLKSGAITSSGLNMGIFHSENDFRLFESEWVPGGCLAHKKSDLILENYYPFTGKAYFEDVYHSILLRKKSVKLLVDNKAICYIEPFKRESFSSNLDEFNYFKKYRIHLIKLLDGNLFNFNLEFLLYVILFVKQKFISSKKISIIQWINSLKWRSN